MARPSSPSRIGLDLLGRAELQWVSYVLVLAGIVAVLALGRPGSVPSQRRAVEAPGLPPANHRLNPNTAGWSDLAALRGLGPTLAKRIVAHREAQRVRLVDPQAMVFRGPADLRAVRGIGPKRAAALSRVLFFSDPAR